MNRSRRVYAVVAVALVAAFALGAVLSSALGNGDDEPEVVRYPLAQTSKVRGAPDRDLILSKVTVDPGATLAAHYHQGTQVARIVAGVLNYTVESGSVPVYRGPSDKPRKVRTIKAGQTARLHAGEWLVEQPNDIHRAANRGGKRVVIFLATLLKHGAPPATAASLP